METAGHQCTPAEIEEKRRIAEEKRRKAKEKKTLMQLNNNNQNRLELKPDQIIQPSSVVAADGNQQAIVVLDPVKKTEIERNRLAALERLKARKLISQQAANDRAAEPGKAPAPHKTSNNRSNPYDKPNHSNLINQQSAAALPGPSRFQPEVPSPGKALTSARPVPYQKPTETKPQASKPPVKVLCQFEMISDDRFVVKLDNYSEVAIQEFKKMKSGSYSKWTELIVNDSKLIIISVE